MFEVLFHEGLEVACGDEAGFDERFAGRLVGVGSGVNGGVIVAMIRSQDLVTVVLSVYWGFFIWWVAF
jgi:hypothetical protein